MGTLLYDPDCGFCTRSAEQLERLGARCGIEPGTRQRLEALRVDVERASREIPFVDDDGTVRWGAAAIAAALATGPVPARLAAAVLRAPVVRALAERVYRVVARNRHRMPGGTAFCKLPDPPTT